MAKILIADKIAQQGIDLLSRDHEVVVATGLEEDALCEAVRDAQALIVRSQTQVTAPVIQAAQRLEIIARAGVGVDNVDVPAATAAGVVVVNAPHANTISTAEHAFALMLALARNVAQGHSSLKEGKWDRSSLQGVELAGKTLGIVGLGRIGTEVARRGRVFDMRVLAYDPYLSDDRFAALGVERRDLDALVAESDFISLHSILNAETRNQINAERLAKFKKGARLINVARGALVDEQALFDAVESGHLAGAAIDVFSAEPAIGNILTTSSKILVNPHLAASTNEAQDRAAIDVAEQVLEVLAGGAPRFPVNVPTVAPDAMAIIGPYLGAAQLAGSVAMQLREGNLQRVRVGYLGDIGNQDTTPLRAAAAVGMLGAFVEQKVSAVNALAEAEAHGLKIDETTGAAPEPYSNVIEITLTTDRGEETVTATNAEAGPAIVGINEYRVDISLGSQEHVLLVENVDKPGSIGRVGTLMGECGVNINSMSVAPGSERSDHALMLIGIERALTSDEVARVAALEGIHRVQQISLR